MNKLIQFFKNYFNIDVINIDKKIVITTISTSLILTIYHYYIALNDFSDLLNQIGLSTFASNYKENIIKK